MDISKLTFDELCYKWCSKIHARIYMRDIENVGIEDYFRRYASYRHALMAGVPGNRRSGDNFLTAVPNPGAGIGHQMANWMAGFYYARLFGLNFAHVPFSDEHHPLTANKWDGFLGLGDDEIKCKDLSGEGFEEIVLPLFDGNDKEQLRRIKEIVDSYSDSKVVFVCEQDQFLKDLFLIQGDLQNRFRKASARQNDKLRYDKRCFNIAVHVRRGDILADQENPNLAMRYLANDYYCNVIREMLKTIKTDKEIQIYVFSQGDARDYPEFNEFDNMHWCLDMDAQSAFLHLVYADLLITSKSSFSYKPALLNNGVKVCPRHFWHGYPDADDWVLCEDDGTISENEIRKLMI